MLTASSSLHDPNRTFAARAVKPGSAAALPEADHDAAIMRVDRTARRELEKTAPQINKRLGRIGRQPGLLMRPAVEPQVARAMCVAKS